ncbi:MAG: type II secretion system F family protein [Firmicutes bacterium]|nr:type II secretion system F family protein [Bacillota bacterium]
MTDYFSYHPPRRERIRYYLSVCPLLALLGILFYRSVLMAAACAFLAKPCERFYTAWKIRGRRNALQEGFRDALYSLSASVAAGRSMPAALSDAASQSEASYGPDADITRELRTIVNVYSSVHGDAAQLLSDFGQRSGIAEISQFASSYSICRLCVGDLEEVCMKSAGLLLDRLSFRKESESLMAQKRLDIALLVSLPVLMLAFLNLVSYDYISVLYQTLSGRLIMTLCLLAMGGAVWWSVRIIDIDL